MIRKFPHFSIFQSKLVPHLIENRYIYFSKSLVLDRRLLDKSQLVYAYLREQPYQGTYTINLPSDQGIGRTARVETSS